MDTDLDLLLTTGLDQPLPFNPSNMFQVLDEVIQRAINENNPEVAFDLGAQMITTGRLMGLGLSRMIYALSERWAAFEIDESFEDYASPRLGLAKETIRRSVYVQSMLTSGKVPEKVVEVLEQRPMKDLNAIATAFAGGYTPTEDQWQRLANAPDNSSVLKELRDIKQAPPRSNQMTLYFKQDGTIMMIMAGGNPVEVGWLHANSANPDVQKAITRIVSNAGMMRE